MTFFRMCVFTATVALGIYFFSTPSVASGLQPAGLRCENTVAPLGVDVSSPRLSWQFAAVGEVRGKRQTAYRILASSSRALLAKNVGDLWDTGKVMSGDTLQIAYAGQTLHSARQVFWKVQTWDESGVPGAWSETGTWTMGLLAPQDWQARWISPPGASSLIGYHAAEATSENETKWVQVDLGTPQPISAVRLIPMDHAGRKGFGFPVRFKVEAGNDPDFQAATPLLNRTDQDYPSPGTAPVTASAQNVRARYVRVTATRLPRRDARVYAFALAQLQILSANKNIAVGKNVTVKDSVERFGWGKAALTDGRLPGMSPSQTVLLRREFVVRPKLRRAVLFVCGLGQYELSLNGQRVGNALLAPGWSFYPKTCLYDTYDVTTLVRPGANAAGLVLGHGMYNIQPDPVRYVKFLYSAGPLKAIALLRLEYADGSHQIVGTDAGWHTAPGPITYDNLFAGEDYDARREPTGWDRAAFRTSDLWQTAKETTGPGGVLRGLTHAAPPIRRIEMLRPVKVTPLRPGVFVYDLGQNASVMPQLSVHGPRGSSVRIIPAELLGKDGAVDRASATQDGVRPAWWQYTLRGQNPETWFPKFFYHGSRYFQVELRPAEGGAELPTLDRLEGVVVHSSSAPIGQFTTSSDLFNRIFNLVRWAQRSNMMSLMTDCPHRERLGWLEETQLNGPSLRYNFDMAPLMAKLVNDMHDSQLENGLVPNIAPEYFIASTPKLTDAFRNSPEWGSAFILVPWQQYQFSGDTSLLRHRYEDMKRYVAFLGNTATDNIVPTGLGDWYDVGPKPAWGSQLTPPPFTATAFYYYDTTVLARIAALLGKPDEARQFTAKAQEIRASFNRMFYNAETGIYATGSQTCSAFPLVLDLVEPDQRPRVLAALITDIKKHGNALTTGEIGYRYLLCALSNANRSDIVFAINNQSEKPGYGYQIKNGGTSLAEKWDGSVGSFGSQNHFMSGEIIEWFYHDLAGIGQTENSAGFQDIVIKPAIVGDLTDVWASYDSVRGRIISHWKRENDRVTMEVTIPPNTTATIWVPATNAVVVTESGRLSVSSPGVTFLRSENGAALYKVGSGHYRFAASPPVCVLPELQGPSMLRPPLDLTIPSSAK
jgi:alpha-L-rhamnosidase